MKKNQTPFPYRKVLKAAGWATAVLLFLFTFSASIADNQIKECSNVYIKVDHNEGLFFVNEEDVHASIKTIYETDLKGMLLKRVDFTGIEEQIESNPFVENVEVYSSVKGAVNVDIKQREPLLRIVNNAGVSYYLDVNGEKIPTSSKFTARVVVATGYVENAAHPEILGGLVRLCRFISNNDFWKAQFEQIHVRQNGEFELVPKLGNHIIRLGIADNLEEKFNKLMVFYKEVLKNFDADNFRIINLQYENQIVCTKNSL